jgi:hypothetical protein
MEDEDYISSVCNSVHPIHNNVPYYDQNDGSERVSTPFFPHYLRMISFAFSSFVVYLIK